MHSTPRSLYCFSTIAALTAATIVASAADTQPSTLKSSPIQAEEFLKRHTVSELYLEATTNAREVIWKNSPMLRERIEHAMVSVHAPDIAAVDFERHNEILFWALGNAARSNDQSLRFYALSIASSHQRVLIALAMRNPKLAKHISVQRLKQLMVVHSDDDVRRILLAEAKTWQEVPNRGPPYRMPEQKHPTENSIAKTAELKDQPVAASFAQTMLTMEYGGTYDFGQVFGRCARMAYWGETKVLPEFALLAGSIYIDNYWPIVQAGLDLAAESIKEPWAKENEVMTNAILNKHAKDKPYSIVFGGPITVEALREELNIFFLPPREKPAQ